MSKDKELIKKIYKKKSTKELMKIANSNGEEYLQEAIEIAQEELKRRGK